MVFRNQKLVDTSAVTSKLEKKRENGRQAQRKCRERKKILLDSLRTKDVQIDEQAKLLSDLQEKLREQTLVCETLHTELQNARDFISIHWMPSRWNAPLYVPDDHELSQYMGPCSRPVTVDSAILGPHEGME